MVTAVPAVVLCRQESEVALNLNQTVCGINSDTGAQTSVHVRALSTCTTVDSNDRVAIQCRQQPSTRLLMSKILLSASARLLGHVLNHQYSTAMLSAAANQLINQYATGATASSTYSSTGQKGTWSPIDAGGFVLAGLLNILVDTVGVSAREEEQRQMFDLHAM